MCRRNFNPHRRFEQLEDRRMMAGDVDFSNGVLTIDGAGYDDVAEIRFEDDRVYVDLQAGESDGDTDHSDDDRAIANVSKIVFNGFAGDDTVTIIHNTLIAGVTLDNLVLEFHGGDDNDTLRIEDTINSGVRTLAWGDAGNDVLWGSRYNDVFEGGPGDDTMLGDAGNDRYVFAGSNLGTDEIADEASYAGSDTLDFANLGYRVNVDLTDTYQYFGDCPTCLGLILPSGTAIENVIGTAFDDVIVGNSRSNHLRGGFGNDAITGAAGNDTLEGGRGHDTYFFAGTNLGFDNIIEDAKIDNDALDFTGMTHGLTIDIARGNTSLAVDSVNLRLRLSNDAAIETVYGTNYDDHIFGNKRDNFLYGRAGNDEINGREGADLIDGGDHDDRIWTDALDHAWGGLGKDVFDGLREGGSNPRPTRYLDWGLL